MLSRDLFHQGENLLAIEVHRCQMNVIYEATAPQEQNRTLLDSVSLFMDISLLPLSSKCNMRNSRSLIYDSYNVFPSSFYYIGYCSTYPAQNKEKSSFFCNVSCETAGFYRVLANFDVSCETFAALNRKKH